MGESGGLDPVAQCASCGAAALTTLPLVLTDGTDVTFISCHTCEARAWYSQDEDGAWASLPIASVLERSARKPR